MSLNIALIESNFNQLKPKAAELANRFYERLFQENPELRPMFSTSLTEQKAKLVGSLATIVCCLRQPEKLTRIVQDLGLRHVDYGVRRDQYPVVGKTLLATLAELTGDAWTEELEQSWAAAYCTLQSIIFDALDEAEAGAFAST